VIGRFYRWRRNPLAAKPPYPKPPKPFYPHIWHALYPQNNGLSTLKPLQKHNEKVIKCFKTPGKNLERFDNYGKSFK